MRRLLLIGGLALVLIAVATIAFGGPKSAPQPQSPTIAAGSDLERLSNDTLAAGIASLQAHLRNQPKDSSGWATLGLAYVEQARLTGDANYYPKAESALRESLEVGPADNDAAYAGLGALAAARHDFDAALANADKALAINAYGARALAVRTDALTELGSYDEALAAGKQADTRQPGLPTFTRLSYQYELRGNPTKARKLLRRALENAFSTSDQAFLHFQLGELARTNGDYRTAASEYDLALRADPASVPALAGRARIRVIRGDVDAATRDYTRVVDLRPEPQYLVELGDLYASRGQRDQAAAQYAIVDTWRELAKAGGVRTDLETALFEADHGSAGQAVREARQEWKRRKSIHVADALAWSLHMAGRDREAITYAGQAARTGYRSATFAYHHGMIAKALGQNTKARQLLSRALAIDPHFSPLHAPRARAALAELTK
ncbi:tetratricopeptide repeat protein [Flindersiella endophytica]